MIIKDKSFGKNNKSKKENYINYNPKNINNNYKINKIILFNKIPISTPITLFPINQSSPFSMITNKN